MLTPLLICAIGLLAAKAIAVEQSTLEQSIFIARRLVALIGVAVAWTLVSPSVTLPKVAQSDYHYRPKIYIGNGQKYDHKIPATKKNQIFAFGSELELTVTKKCDDQTAGIHNLHAFAMRHENSAEFSSDQFYQGGRKRKDATVTVTVRSVVSPTSGRVTVTMLCILFARFRSPLRVPPPVLDLYEHHQIKNDVGQVSRRGTAEGISLGQQELLGVRAASNRIWDNGCQVSMYQEV
ncbi:hypothetical protein B0H14DRAFT_2645133 [Mycena olivaceomarginata]|nr:hypothetical protein B0H14DRAFT_2645133 [Mycena olivaceomarginata]